VDVDLECWLDEVSLVVRLDAGKLAVGTTAETL
jgi:hypothetical protein